jgi:proteasome lid subunit RPN8/RPN11
MRRDIYILCGIVLTASAVAQTGAKAPKRFVISDFGGWYISHTRSEILLSERDLQLFQQYFPELWQIALVHREGDGRRRQLSSERTKV